MAQLTLRLLKGSPVTFEEMDSNLLALDSDSPFRVAAGHIGYDGKVVFGPDGADPAYVPTYDLDFGNGSITNTFDIGGNTDINFHVDTNKEFRVLTDGTERFTILGNGNIGIGNTNPNQPLEVNGNIQSNATVLANQGFFTSVYDGFMTIVGGSVFNGVNADYSGQISFGSLSDGAVPPMVAFEIDEVLGSSVIIPSSSAVRNSLDSEVAVLNARDDSEHAFNVRTHLEVDSDATARTDSDHAWAVVNFDSEHNWANNYINNVDSDAVYRDDSEHTWVNNYIAQSLSDLDSALDSEHAWNVAEHNQLQANIDSEHLYALSQSNLLNARADSEHAWANSNFDSEHAWNVASHDALQANIDSDHLWAIRNFDSEHTWANDNFDSEHFWAKRYIEAGDSVVDSELKKQIRIQDANMDSEHAWNVAEHGELQQNIDSDHDWAVINFAGITNANDSEHLWNVQEHLKLDSNIDSDHRWARDNFDSDHFWARDNFDSEHTWARDNFDSEHTWANANFDSEHTWANANFDSEHTWANANFDSEHTWARDELDSIYTDLSARADSEHAWAVANFDSEHAWNVAEHDALQVDIDSVWNSLQSFSGAAYTSADQAVDFDSALALKTTDNLAEGTTNLYYTPARADSDARFAVSGGNGITYTAATGVIAQTPQTINTVSYNGTAPIVVEPFVERDDATNATRKLVFVDDATAGHKRLNMDTNLSYNPSTNTLTATTFAGNASTATALNPGSTINTVAYNGTAAIVVEPFVERDDTTNANRVITFVDNTTAGHKRLNMDANLTYNPSTNIMATSISGNAATATILQTARTINTVSFNGSANIVVEPFVERDDATNANRPLTFVDNTTAGHKRLNMDANLLYNPSTNTLTATRFAGTATQVLNSLNFDGTLYNGSAAVTITTINGGTFP